MPKMGLAWVPKKANLYSGNRCPTCKFLAPGRLRSCSVRSIFGLLLIAGKNVDDMDLPIQNKHKCLRVKETTRTRCTGHGEICRQAKRSDNPNRSRAQLPAFRQLLGRPRYRSCKYIAPSGTYYYCPSLSSLSFHSIHFNTIYSHYSISYHVPFYSQTYRIHRVITQVQSACLSPTTTPRNLSPTSSLPIPTSIAENVSV